MTRPSRSGYETDASATPTKHSGLAARNGDGCRAETLCRADLDSEETSVEV